MMTPLNSLTNGSLTGNFDEISRLPSGNLNNLDALTLLWERMKESEESGTSEIWTRPVFEG